MCFKLFVVFIRMIFLIFLAMLVYETVRKDERSTSKHIKIHLATFNITNARTATRFSCLHDYTSIHSHMVTQKRRKAPQITQSTINIIALKSINKVFHLFSLPFVLLNILQLLNRFFRPPRSLNWIFSYFLHSKRFVLTCSLFQGEWTKSR